ncbi:MAG: alpha-glucosidase [Bacteroidetes bacterium]|nr:alpha-glucosidase [Bacteroidota bacterium]
MKYLPIILLALIGISCNTKEKATPQEKTWWKEAIVYQLYPRSFKDSDGDGVGDLKGVLSELDYIQRLGVTAVWFNPIFTSPNDDNGYDVSDYRGIMKEFGTMADFDSLLKGLHQRKIRVVMDLVVNHSSDEHEWFRQSRSSRTSPYRNYYHWWPAEKGKPPYRYSLFDVNHDAWMYDSATNAYYLHFFSRKQPDLNWENPKLRDEVYDIMKFWADKGIDGFRLDAFGFAAKDTLWPAFPKGYEKNFMPYYSMQKGLHDYLREMNSEVLSKYDVLSVAEGAGNSLQDAHDLVDADRHELNMAYPFDWIDVPKPEGYDLVKLKGIISNFDSAFRQKGWLAMFLANHDQARMVSRFASDAPEFRDLSSKMLNTFILTMRGTPFVYYGDELGMSNIRFDRIEDYRDMPTLNEYQRLKNTGGDLRQFIENLKFGCRDNGRTPMQWNDRTQAGFTSGTPWIKVHPNYTSVNVAAEAVDSTSCLNYFRTLTKLRKDYPTLVYGTYTLLDKNNPDVYAYLRELDGEKILVALNFTDHKADVKLGLTVAKAGRLAGNYAQPIDQKFDYMRMRPYEAVVWKLE